MGRFGNWHCAPATFNDAGNRVVAEQHTGSELPDRSTEVGSLVFSDASKKRSLSTSRSSQDQRILPRILPHSQAMATHFRKSGRGVDGKWKRGRGAGAKERALVAVLWRPKQGLCGNFLFFWWRLGKRSITPGGRRGFRYPHKQTHLSARPCPLGARERVTSLYQRSPEH